MTHFNGSCETCKFCQGNVRDTSGHCTIIKMPITGTPMPVTYARMDEWQGYALPCGYKGNLWQAKDA